MRRFVVFGILLLSVAGAFGQEPFTLLDTVYIEEVVSYGAIRKYQSGAKIEEIAPVQFELAADGNLQQLLSRSLPIPFKADAGGLATIRIRGTAPNHTSINFGGININSLTLGQSNFSNVPLYLFDNVGVQFGSASSVNGSGSMGGAIHLGLKNNWTHGFRAEVRTAFGAFGEQLYGTKIFTGNGKFEAVTRAYYYAKRNDFPFVNTYYRDFEKSIFEFEDRQQNAAIENKGILQEFNYRFDEDEFFLANIWLEQDWHEVQQNMQTNLANPDYREVYEDEHLRLWLAYKNRKNPLKFEVSGAYVYDNSVFNHSTSDRISTRRIIGEAFIDHSFSRNASYKAGVKTSRISPDVYAYTETLEHENRFDFYASYYQRLLDALTLTLNLRQGFVTDFKVPFTPSLGLEFLAVSKRNSALRLNGNIARSYRVPTFNDRFWVPGGNPDLKPETGMSYELGTKWTYTNNGTAGKIKLNLFVMNIDDWILWKNGGAFWYAENVQKVQSKGIEFMTDWSYQLASLEMNSGLNYSFTSAQRIESENQTNALNRQLEYVPLHAASFFTGTSIKNFNFSVDGSFTGKQYTDEEKENILSAYFLLNVTTRYKLKFNDVQKVSIQAMVNNLLDTAYQSSWAYAMPGIAWRLSITYHFN